LIDLQEREIKKIEIAKKYGISSVWMSSETRRDGSFLGGSHAKINLSTTGEICELRNGKLQISHDALAHDPPSLCWRQFGNVSLFFFLLHITLYSSNFIFIPSLLELSIR
jgi:hypothetical protein